MIGGILSWFMKWRALFIFLIWGLALLLIYHGTIELIEKLGLTWLGYLSSGFAILFSLVYFLKFRPYLR